MTPEEHWRTPAAFIDRPLLRRTSKSWQLPTGGAVYFDGGVLEVVTPVIEIAPQCTARVVRSVWEQIGFIRDQLDRWERRSGRDVRLQAFSTHVNISYELPRKERNRNRTIQKLAYLLARLLPAPVIVAGANRRSTGIGFRPRRDRIEITLDFTPDPGLMAATTALIVGIVRDVIPWPSYLLSEIETLPLIEDLNPGKHPTRNGWVLRDYHFSKNPFQSDLDERIWRTTRGLKSLREIAQAIAVRFRRSIRKYSDPFSFGLLLSLLRGETPALLDLPDRPAAYDDVGHSIRWGGVLPELDNYATLMESSGPRRRRSDVEERLAPPWRGGRRDRRTRVVLPARTERHARKDRRAQPPPAPSPRLTRSAYEKVFLKLASGKRLKIGNELLTPIAVKGWYHSLFRAPNGEERLLSIDQILHADAQWRT